MAQILVTGGAGFIGSNLVDALLAAGHLVVVVDNLTTGFKHNLNPQAEFIKADITDEKAMTTIFQNIRPDYVYHLAAQIDVRQSVDRPLFDAQTNILGSLNVINNCRLKEQHIKLIYISTGGAVYGVPEYLPADEQHPVNPLCPYGISKHVPEHYLYYYQREKGLKYTVLRLPNVYGPRQNPEGEAGVVAIFLNLLRAGQSPVLYGHGQPTRDYVYVADVVSAMLLAMTKGDNEIINLGWGREVSVNEVYDACQEALNTNIKPSYADLRAGEVEAIALKADKAKRILDWEPKVGLPEGIKRTAKWLLGTS